MNLSILLLARLAANRQGDSSSDAGRVSLKATIIRPPVMGLLVATVIAREAKLFLEDPDVQRALKGLTRKDERRLRQLEATVSALHRAVDGVRGRLASGRARKAVPSTRTGRAVGGKRAGR